MAEAQGGLMGPAPGSVKSVIRSAVRRFSEASRQKRAEVFRNAFAITQATRILDLGGGSGAHIEMLIGRDADITVADVEEADLARAAERGYKTALLKDGESTLPFPDNAFDIVFCSSVIEHVTIPYKDIWTLTDTKRFVAAASSSQAHFANEIRRVGRCYFVQTPYRYFPIESHSWLPMPIVLMPRPMQVSVLRFTNKFWPKYTGPDWHLLTGRDMRQLFPDAHIVDERVAGMCKSLIAIRN